MELHQIGSVLRNGTCPSKCVSFPTTATMADRVGYWNACTSSCLGVWFWLLYLVQFGGGNVLSVCTLLCLFTIAKVKIKDLSRNQTSNKLFSTFCTVLWKALSDILWPVFGYMCKIIALRMDASEYFSSYGWTSCLKTHCPLLEAAAAKPFLEEKKKKAQYGWM